MKYLLELKDVDFSYSNKNTNGKLVPDFALRNISFGVNEGDFISIIGTNGSGKSTLVKLISKILVGYKGNILYNEKEIHSIERKEYSRLVSYIPQSSGMLNEDLTVNEFLLYGRYAHKGFMDFKYTDEDRSVVNAGVKETGIEELTDKQLHRLSGGEKQKVLITLALVQLDITKSLNEKMLIIDEPLTYLDVNHQFEIFNILEKLKNKNLTVIIVIHDLNLALRFSGKTILINNGVMIKYGDTKSVITEEMLKEHFLIDSKIHNYEKNFFINYFPN